MASGREASVQEGPVAGLDGCRAGWVLATVRPTPSGPGRPRIEIRVIDGLEAVAEDLASGRLAAAGIDIPIGLPPRGPRACDVAARRMLGPRRSTVFPAPARRVLAATTYEEACARSRAVNGTAVSKQLFNILPKIREVDRLLARTPSLQAQLFEMCPELGFGVLTGRPMLHAKRTADGRAERLSALRRPFGDVADLVARPPAGAARDDVLDALVGAWTARRFATGTCLRLGGVGDIVEIDETGLRMEVSA
jgi:predicted RNase H-like nuclease